MPFASQRQRRFLYAKHPDVAEEFAKETPKGAKLPEVAKRAAGMAVRGLLAKKRKKKLANQ